jgi:hypothetical protein
MNYWLIQAIYVLILFVTYCVGFYRGVNRTKEPAHVHDWGPWQGGQGVIGYPQIRFCQDPRCGKKEVS